MEDLTQNKTDSGHSHPAVPDASHYVDQTSA